MTRERYQPATERCAAAPAATRQAGVNPDWISLLRRVTLLLPTQPRYRTHPDAGKRCRVTCVSSSPRCDVTCAIDPGDPENLGTGPAHDAEADADPEAGQARPVTRRDRGHHHTDHADLRAVHGQADRQDHRRRDRVRPGDGHTGQRVADRHGADPRGHPGRRDRATGQPADRHGEQQQDQRHAEPPVQVGQPLPHATPSGQSTASLRGCPRTIRAGPPADPPLPEHDRRMRCLVAGATGYVGGRLVPRLLGEGYEVRCLTRSARRLRDVPWAGAVEIVEGDVTDPAGLPAAMEGVDVVYYLVHALGRAGFEEQDRVGAGNTAEAARAAGVGRIVYLGGPVPDARQAATSAHLRSRAEVAEILLASGVPTVVLRAAVIIGSGSASFEMLRYLTERLPVVVTPRWVRSRIQPVAVRDVLRYLVGAATLPAEVNRGFDIGGPDVLTYAEMMHRYSDVAGLRPRVLIPVPLLTPRLSSLWVGLVTPVPAGLAMPLVESLRNEV